jgi:Dynamin family
MAAMPNGESTLASALSALAVLGTERDRAQLVALLDRLDAVRLRVLVAGEAKRGKSTLVNALLGRQVLPSGVIPLTAVTTTVRYGDDERAEVRFLDGHDEKHPLAALTDLGRTPRTGHDHRHHHRPISRGRIRPDADVPDRLRDPRPARHRPGAPR